MKIWTKIKWHVFGPLCRSSLPKHNIVKRSENVGPVSTSRPSSHITYPLHCAILTLTFTVTWSNKYLSRTYMTRDSTGGTIWEISIQRTIKWQSVLKKYPNLTFLHRGPLEAKKSKVGKLNSTFYVANFLCRLSWITFINLGAIFGLKCVVTKNRKKIIKICFLGFMVVYSRQCKYPRKARQQCS